MLSLATAAALLSFCSGCASLICTQPDALNGISIKGIDGKPSQMVVIDTTGYYFLWTVPLASGDLRWNNETQSIEGGTELFSDHVSISELQDALTNYAECRNCDLADVSYYDADTSYAEASYFGIIGMLFGESRMAVSGILVPREAANN